MTPKPRSTLMRKFSSDPVRIQLVARSSVTARVYGASVCRFRRTSGADRLARPGGESRRTELLVLGCGRVEQIPRGVGIGLRQQPAAQHQAARRVEWTAQVEPALARFLDRGRTGLRVFRRRPGGLGLGGLAY